MHLPCTTPAPRVARCVGIALSRVSCRGADFPVPMCRPLRRDSSGYSRADTSTAAALSQCFRTTALNGTFRIIQVHNRYLPTTFVYNVSFFVDMRVSTIKQHNHCIPSFKVAQFSKLHDYNDLWFSPNNCGEFNTTILRLKQ